jgi:hypothetical protein
MGHKSNLLIQEVRFLLPSYDKIASLISIQLLYFRTFQTLILPSLSLIRFWLSELIELYSEYQVPNSSLSIMIIPSNPTPKTKA